jgi:hypothetical protein
MRTSLFLYPWQYLNGVWSVSAAPDLRSLSTAKTTQKGTPENILIYTGIVYQRAKQRMTTKAFHITRRRSFSVQCPAASTNAIAESTNKQTKRSDSPCGSWAHQKRAKETPLSEK